MLDPDEILERKYKALQFILAMLFFLIIGFSAGSCMHRWFLE